MDQFIHVQLKNALQSTSWGFRVTSPKSVVIPLIGIFKSTPDFVRPSLIHGQVLVF